MSSLLGNTVNRGRYSGRKRVDLLPALWGEAGTRGVKMRWINDRDVYCRCPACGWVFPKGTEKLNACQHCGARMDDEEQE